jgi:DNA polymerase III sliding clamp (beta) subunit (PCNA family)
MNPALGGVSLGDGWAAATDGYRLAAARADAELPSCLVPADVVTHVAKMMPAGCSLASDGRQAMFDDRRTSITARLITAPFADWQRLVPDPTATHHTLEARRDELVDALERAERVGFGAEHLRYAKVTIRPRAGALSVTSDQPDLGEIDETVAGTTTLDAISFNARYLRQALEHVSAAVVVLRTAGGMKPAVIDDTGGLQLVMPVHT